MGFYTRVMSSHSRKATATFLPPGNDTVGWGVLLFVGSRCYHSDVKRVKCVHGVHGQRQLAVFSTEYVAELSPGFLEDSDGDLVRRNKDLVPSARADESKMPYCEMEGDDDRDLAELIINEDKGKDVFERAESQKHERTQEQTKEEMRQEWVASRDGAEMTLGRAMADSEKKQEVDESAKVVDVPVPGERREKGWLDGVSNQDLRRKRERLASGKSPRSKIVCGNSGAGVVGEFQGIGFRGPEPEVSQEPGPGRAGRSYERRGQGLVGSGVRTGTVSGLRWEENAMGGTRGGARREGG